ncbi:MAG: heavy metal translocating P-type ATPase [Thermoplasmataceae archaeon]
MPTDPVCGMFVPDNSTLTLEKNGKTYYFCSRDCMEKFMSPEDQIRRLKMRLIVAWVFSIPVLLLTYLISFPEKDYILLTLALPVQFYSGLGFYSGAYQAIRNRMGNMDILISMGTLTAFFFSLFITFFRGIIPGSNVYFDASSFIITLILTGSFVESVTKKSAGDAASRLLEIMPKTAHVMKDGTVIDVPADQVKPGDRISIRAGEVILADGTVDNGSGDVDPSAITGEQEPITVFPGDRVISGMRNMNGSLTVRVEKAGQDSTISRIYEMLQAASSGRAKIQRVADIFSTYFVPVVLISAAISATTWALILRGTGLDISVPVLAFVSVVVIACPCAIGLAAPIVMLIASSRASSRGILFKNTSVLDRLSRTTMVVFDKTGTVTESVPSIARIETNSDRDRFLSLAFAVESHSNHPVARAIVKYCRENGIPEYAASDVVETPGSGIQGRVDHHAVSIERSTEAAGSAVSLSVDGSPAGTIFMEYKIRPEVSGVVERLRAMNVKVAMVSGDRRSAVESVAMKIGIDNYQSECTPERKADIIRSYQEKGEFVAFVGDGINDAIVMETSDAGIAVSSASDIAMDAGDLILARDDLTLVVEAMVMARLSMRKIRQNIGWAIGYNSILIPVAAGILVPAFGLGIYSFLPMLSALAMGFSSTSVVLNSLLLKHSFRITSFGGSEGQAVASGA